MLLNWLPLPEVMTMTQTSFVRPLFSLCLWGSLSWRCRPGATFTVVSMPMAMSPIPMSPATRTVSACSSIRLPPYRRRPERRSGRGFAGRFSQGERRDAESARQRSACHSRTGTRQRAKGARRSQEGARRARRHSPGQRKNYQKVEERLQPYRDKVAQHERNIQAINKELSGAK